MIPENEIFHVVCSECNPEFDIAICGTRLTFDESQSVIVNDNDIGQDCVVCSNMECPTCESPQIKGTVG